MTNTDVSAFAQQHPLDGEKFSNLMRRVRPDWAIKIYDVTNSILPEKPNACDGYIITGSPASVHDERPWIARLFEFIRALDKANVPTIGCCFGHQAIAMALGGTVSRNPGGWGFGTAVTEFKKREPWMQPYADAMTLFAAHNEQVAVLPQGAEVLGSNAFTPAASFKISNRFFTTQYHPEMTPEFMTALSYEIDNYVGPDLAATARKQAKAATHGGHFAEWMAKFLELPR
jgi:GMP synthase-like glutamine amidotransferase